jgi:Domain of unknown function (DUF5658)
MTALVFAFCAAGRLFWPNLLTGDDEAGPSATDPVSSDARSEQEAQPAEPAVEEEVSAALRETAIVETGYLFADGRYIPPPYHIAVSPEGKVYVNGEVLPGEIGFGGARGEYSRPQPMPGRGFGWGRGFAFRPREHRHLQSRLEAEQVVVTFSDAQVVNLPDQTYHFLKSLTDPDPTSEHFRALLAALPAETATRWRAWITGFDVPPDLQARAEEMIGGYEAALAENQAQIRAVRILDTIGYPLTVTGMLLAVIALGHLLMSVPNRMATHPEARRELPRATTISLVLIIAFSAFDLVWTILTAQSGQMREMNPIGSRLVDSPELLIGFKLAATGVGCGLLYALRRHGRAQLASWWLCLVCTVLTFRWLMFNSMFMA